MKKFFMMFLYLICISTYTHAYQVLSTKEFGKDDAKNQNIIVRCTTDTGKISNQTCSLRRYAKCTNIGNQKKCNSWQPWKDLRNTTSNYSDWKSAATSCCKAKGFR